MGSFELFLIIFVRLIIQNFKYRMCSNLYCCNFENFTTRDVFFFWRKKVERFAYGYCNMALKLSLDVRVLNASAPYERYISFKVQRKKQLNN